MLVRYQFVNGEISEVEVGRDVGEAIMELEREQGLRERVETRRHVLLQNRYDGEWCAVYEDIDGLLSRVYAVPLVQAALLALSPKQRDLLYLLYMSETPISQAEYAVRLGIDERSVQQNARRARMALVEALKELT